MTDEAEIRAIHNRFYGSEPHEVAVSSAPGRVNLIGEHTDYNDGYVLPVPLRSRIFAAGRPNGTGMIRLYAADYSESASQDLEEIEFDSEHLWANYPLGVAHTMLKRGLALTGVDLVIKGDVPREAGLSSSAAVEMATARLFRGLFELEINPIELAYIGKETENDFVGVQSGIMDQFVASLGRTGEALFIDCRTNDYEHITLPPGHAVVVTNTMVKRELASSAYNERRSQCEEGVRIMKEELPEINALRDVFPSDLNEYREKLPEIIYRRCRHVVTENARVLESVQALRGGDVEKIGGLMYASHESLRDDYEVTSPELDTLVDAARGVEGVAGARMTGAGFGGCTVNLVRRERVEDFTEAIIDAYMNVTGIKPEVYLV